MRSEASAGFQELLGDVNQGLKRKISEAAEAGGLKADYEAHYSLLSKAAHNTPVGLASKDDPRILATSVLRLLYDTIRASECLAYFRETDNSEPLPLTKNWKEVCVSLPGLLKDYAVLSERLKGLFNVEMGRG